MINLEVRAARWPHELLGWIRIPPAYADLSNVGWPVPMIATVTPTGQVPRESYGEIRLPIRPYEYADGRLVKVFLCPPKEAAQLRRIPRFTPA